MLAKKMSSPFSSTSLASSPASFDQARSSVVKSSYDRPAMVTFTALSFLKLYPATKFTSPFGNYESEYIEFDPALQAVVATGAGSMGLEKGIGGRQGDGALSGPGLVSFADASASITTASFSIPGSYTLQLLAQDGEATVSADAVAEASHYRCSDLLGSGDHNTVNHS